MIHANCIGAFVSADPLVSFARAVYSFPTIVTDTAFFWGRVFIASGTVTMTIARLVVRILRAL